MAADDPAGARFLVDERVFDVYTFSTSTVGGQGAVAALCEAHARATEDAGQYPVVTLAVDSYEHRIKSYGRVKVPLFKLAGAVEAAPFDAIVAGARGGASFTPKSPALERSGIAVAIGRAPPAPPFEGSRRRLATFTTVLPTAGLKATIPGRSYPLLQTAAGRPTTRKATRISNEFRARKSRWTGAKIQATSPMGKARCANATKRRTVLSRSWSSCSRMSSSSVKLVVVPGRTILDAYEDALGRARAALRAGLDAGDTHNALAAFEATQDAALALLREAFTP